MRGDLASQVCSSADPRLQITLPGDTQSVRMALGDILVDPVFADLGCDVTANAQIVLAEVLNNVVEHAYASRSGDISISISRAGDDLFCQIADQGAAMPGNALPPGSFQPLDAIEDLPEGGFGWYLIRLLTDALVYEHVQNTNKLSFWIRSKQATPI